MASLSHLLRLPIVLALLAPSALLAETPTSAPATRQPATTQPRPIIETHFSPEEQIAPTIVKLIDGAQKTLDIAAFSFTHPDIAAATVRARRRGVRVQIIMDY